MVMTKQINTKINEYSAVGKMPAADTGIVPVWKPGEPVRVKRSTILCWRAGRIREKICSRLRSFWQDRRGVGTVETILILVVLIALVLIFRTQLNSLVGKIFQAISKNTDKVIK